MVGVQCVGCVGVRAPQLLLVGRIEGHYFEKHFRRLGSLLASSLALVCLLARRRVGSGGVADAKGVVWSASTEQSRIQKRLGLLAAWYVVLLLLLVLGSSCLCMQPGVLEVLFLVPLWKCAFVLV